MDLPAVENVERAQRRRRLPGVFTRREVQPILAQPRGTHHFLVLLLAQRPSLRHAASLDLARATKDLAD